MGRDGTRARASRRRVVTGGGGGGGGGGGAMAREGDDANAVGAVARVVVAFCAGASVAVGVMSTLEARRRRTEEANDARERETTATREETMGSMVTSMVTSTSTRETRTSYDLTDEILREQFTRNVQFFGEAGQEAVRDAFVVVVGLGGVGSHAASMMLRSGVGKLRAIDFDQVSLSSLNRHAVAVRADVGTAKATCLKKHFKAIYPEAVVDARVAMYEAEAENELLGAWTLDASGRMPDFVVDCIDNIDTKVDLLAACKRRGLRVVTSGGAGAKCDPTRLRFADIADCAADPLARAVRYRLGKNHKIREGIQTLISMEKPRCELVAEMELKEGETLSDYQVIPNFRVRTIPVLGCVPAIFGMALASHVLTELAGAPYESEPIMAIQWKQYETQLERLHDRESERGREVSNMAIDIEGIVYLVRETWRALSARDQKNKRLKAYWRNTSGLSMTRWDPSKPAALDNLVLLTTEECDEHDTKCAEPGGFERLIAEEPEFARFVESRIARVRADFALSKDG